MSTMPLDIITFKNSWFGQRYGIVIEVYGFQMVVYFKWNKVVMEPLETIKGITNSNRNWVFTGTTYKYEIQQKIFAFVLNNEGVNLRRLLRKLNKKVPRELLMIYVLTAGYVSYPAEFADGKFTEEDFFDYRLGYSSVWNT